MDQDELKTLENLCIQEEWAFCRAACPLHMDVRAMCLALKQGDLGKARAVVDKTLPVSGILGRICEAPCEKSCKREEAGGPIRIHALEKFCVSSARPSGKTIKIPDRGRRAIILGCGLSGLSAAHDLARKGYKIRLFHFSQDPADELLSCLPVQVDREVVKSELQYLQQLGVSFEKFHPENHQPLELLKLKQPVYTGLDAVDQALLPCSIKDIHPLTLAGTPEGFFAGAWTRSGTVPRAVDQAAAGRKAAVSMDRFTQNVSMTASRELEGPVTTRLVTSLEGVSSVSTCLGGDDPDLEEVKQEAARCLACECMICVRRCPYLEAFKGYPKSYVRQIYNNEAIVKGSRLANTLINSCMLCSLCTRLCPNDFPMARICLEARERMVEQDRMPPSAHDFALRDLEFSRSSDFFLVASEPGFKECDYLFFPGCQLCATHPEQVESVYAWLRASLDKGVGLALACCGAPASWSGRKGLFQEAVEQLFHQAASLGNPTWITACPSCWNMLEKSDYQPEMVSLWEILSSLRPSLNTDQPTDECCLVDPCAARDLPGMRQAVRSLVSTRNLREPELNASYAACCGYGGLLTEANPDLAARAATDRAQGLTGPVLTYCAMCREQLVSSGKQAAHLLEMLFPSGREPFSLPGTGLSARRDNRRRLKNSLMRKVWQKTPLSSPEHTLIALDMAKDVRELTEKRRILESDIQQTIAMAETRGQLFYDDKSGSWLASFTLGQVTFWVRYSVQKDGSYRIHTAYSHRMKIARVTST